MCRFQPILNSIPDPKQPPSNSDSYSESAVFSPCMLDVRSHLWWMFREVWQKEATRSPRSCWYSCFYPEAWQQPLKRGARETDWAPGTDLLPCSPPPKLKRSWPSQLSPGSSPSPAGYIQSSPTGHWLFTCCTGAYLFPCCPWAPSCNRRRHVTKINSWSPEIWRLSVSVVLSTLYMTKNAVERGTNPAKSGQAPWNLLTSRMDLHNTQDHPSAEEVL